MNSVTTNIRRVVLQHPIWEGLLAEPTPQIDIPLSVTMHLED